MRLSPLFPFYLVELLRFEDGGIFVPESVSVSESLELVDHETHEGRPQFRPLDSRLQKATHPHVDVICGTNEKWGMRGKKRKGRGGREEGKWEARGRNEEGKRDTWEGETYIKR